jgi:hypothetical protein
MILDIYIISKTGTNENEIDTNWGDKNSNKKVAHMF